jgi:hypothetical protein
MTVHGGAKQVHKVPRRVRRQLERSACTVARAAETLVMVIASCTADLSAVDIEDQAATDGIITRTLLAATVIVDRMSQLPCHSMDDFEIKRQCHVLAREFAAAFTPEIERS